MKLSFIPYKFPVGTKVKAHDEVGIVIGQYSDTNGGRHYSVRIDGKLEEFKEEELQNV